MAILGETVGAKHMSKTFGVATMFVTAGLFCGPAISGSMFELVGYTTTWLTALAVLIGGTILQSLMLETPKEKVERHPTTPTVSEIEEHIIESDSASNISTLVSEDINHEEREENEHTALLNNSFNRSSDTLYQSIASSTSPEMVFFPKQEQKQGHGQKLYVLLLRRVRVLVALTGDIVFATILASFEATLPLHIQAVFGWKTMGAGLSFVIMQVPALILLGPIGWLKDRFGLRYPIAIGFLLFAPSLLLLSLPGSGHLAWMSQEERGPATFIVALILIGICRTLVLGFGGVEVMSMSPL